MDTRIKEIRKSRGFKSAAAFAASIGMQEKTHRNFEQGVRNLYLDVACDLCDALGCSLDELVGRDVEKKFTDAELHLIECFRACDEDGKLGIEAATNGIAAKFDKNGSQDWKLRERSSSRT